MSTNYFARINGPSKGTTGTGLDQLVDTLGTDLGLAGRISQTDLAGGVRAADAMNAIIVKAIDETKAGANGIFTADDVRTLNAYIRANYEGKWVELHGDDEGRQETGYHLIQNDGASEHYRGQNLANTVADGIYHLGFAIEGDNLLNEDGAPNASVQQVAEWLTQFYTDRSTTGTGLDRMTDMVMADPGLDRKISDAEIAAGAEASNGMAQMIAEAIETQGLANDGIIDVGDVGKINAYLRLTDDSIKEWAALHGDDENGEETGFHLVQNDGACTQMFGQNFVNTVLDGINHLGFTIDEKTGRLLNEDGDANATLSDVADWLTYFYVDQSTTGTGLDFLVDAVKSDRGLAKNTNAGDINDGAAAADAMNHLIDEAIKNGGDGNLAADGLIDIDDVAAINAFLRRTDASIQAWAELHGDDEGCEETGFHLVQNDGGNVQYRGDALINTVADGIYHLGFKIVGDNVLNEDGDPNAGLGDLATWLNQFYLGKENIFGSQAGDQLKGLNTDDRIAGRGGDDTISGGDGDDTLLGDEGNDKLLGQSGDDTLDGGDGNDRLHGGDGADQLAGGTGDDQLYGDAGDDRLAGGDGNDKLGGSDGDDTLDGEAGDDQLYGGRGDDRLAGGDGNDKLGGSDGVDQLDGGAGNDSLYGGRDADDLRGDAGDDYLAGEQGDDLLAGGEGNDKLSGGDGDDELDGGTGDDRLDGGRDNDRLAGGDGNDKLSGGDGVDELDGGAGNDSLNGGRDADVLLGEAGDDYLSGEHGDDVLAGGEGNDVLVGGAGRDVFCFDALLDAATNVDTIKCFSTADDTIALSKTFFAALGLGDLDAGAFYKSATLTTAQEADDRIIYNTTTGSLYYDADGVGGDAQAVQFAVLAGSPDGLMAADFAVLS